MLAIFCLAGCLFGIWLAIREHRQRVTSAATTDLRRAVALRPFDYTLWMALGQSFEASGDQVAAINSLNQAVLCAPFYAQPRWKLGNTLLKSGQRDAAFQHLAVAGSSDPELFYEVTKLAWKEFEGDPAEVEKAVRPKTAVERIKLARFFTWRGLPEKALAIFRATSEISAADQNDLIADLIGSKSFAEAYQVRIRDRKDVDANGLGVIQEAGFETVSSFNEEGFGWKFPRDAGAVNIGFDKSNTGAGERSLRLHWHGNTDASIPTLSQLVLIEPETHYKLHFSVRAQELTSGTTPFVGIADASSNDEPMLAQTEPLTPGDTWQNSTLEFATGKNTKAIRIVLQRPRCAEQPCPIFGRMWLDNFSLERIKHQ